MTLLNNCMRSAVGVAAAFGLVDGEPDNYRLRERTVHVLVIAQIITTLAFTLGKTVFFIPGVWRTANQHARQLRLIPFHAWSQAASFYGPILNAVGNMALFTLLGFVLYSAARSRVEPWQQVVAFIAGSGTPAARRWRWIGFWTVLVLLLEIIQFVFALGYSDVDDLFYGVVGVSLGAVVAQRASQQIMLAGQLLALAGCGFLALCMVGSLSVSGL